MSEIIIRNSDLAADVIGEWGQLQGDRTIWLSRWQDNANYIHPNRSDYLSPKTPGQSRMQYAYDGTAIWANVQLAAGLHGMLTSPTLRWFGLRCEDDRLNQDPDTLAWLDDASDRMYAIFNGSKHNFASQTDELYLDLGSIGTAVMGTLESASSGILFSTHHLRDCCLAENEEDRVDTLYRQFEWTAKKAWQRWGKDAGPTVEKLMADGKPFERLRFLHATRPRAMRDPQRADAKNMPFQSVYVCVDSQTQIQDEGGFREFPYHCPRFSKVTGEIYGRGPGWTNLPDIKMLNEMLRTVLKSAQKIVDPPLMLPDDGFMVPIKTSPGALNFYRAGMRDKLEPLRTGGDIQIGNEMLGELRQRILRGFYVDWLIMPSDPQDPASAGKGVTATYVLQNRDEKMRLLSPMLARMQSEFLGPLIDRTFAIMWRQSFARRFGEGAMFAPPPPSLSGAKLRVEYVSPIALAQAGSELDSMTRLIQAAGMLGQIDPTVPQSIDGDTTLRLIARRLNTPARMLRSPAEVAQRIADQQKQAQDAQDAQQGMAQAKSMRDGAAAVRHLAVANQALGAAQQGGPPGQGGAPQQEAA